MNKTFNSAELKQNAKTVESIKRDYLSGFSIEQLANMYGMTYYTVRQILLDNEVPMRTKNNKVSK